MGIWDSVKNILTIPPEDELEEEFEEEKTEPKKAYTESVKRTDPPAPRVIGGKAKTVNSALGQMQVVLVKPERYDDVTSIADHINAKKTVVLNLENADRELSRRIVDFISGATYANRGNMQKISKGTMLIVPEGVDMMGELFIDDFEEGKMYF